jgi:hypothetical protein
MSASELRRPHRARRNWVILKLMMTKVEIIAFSRSARSGGGVLKPSVR